MPDFNKDFDGAKLALISRGKILTLLRDAKPDIPFPDMWDLPGGGREGGETPIETALRETHEEFGIRVAPDLLQYHVCGTGFLNERKTIWFFGAVDDGFNPETVRFGDEGQKWEMMDIRVFLNHPTGIPHLQERTRAFLTKTGIDL